MLSQGLISQDEFNKLRSEIMNEIAPQAMPRMGSTGKPFSIPSEPLRDRIDFRNPITGEIVKVEKWPTFWLTMLFGCFYLAYKEVWMHAGIALLLAFFTWGLSWLIYPFFTYRIVVDTYRRKGWIEI